MLAPGEALRILLDAVRPLPDEEVAIEEALHRVLAEAVVADRDFPPTDRSAMDGFALRAADAAGGDAVLRVTGELPAGSPAEGLTVREGEAVRIFTGAVIPSGADAVVMVEMTREDRERGSVRVLEPARAGQHVRRRGEDRAAGDQVLAAGDVLGPGAIAALAAVGRDRIRVARRARVGILSTGSEIVDVRRTPQAHEVRNSNAPMLRAQLLSLGIAADDLGIVADAAALIDAAMAKGAAADCLVLSGGVSVGDYDLVGAAVRRAGYEILFHNVAMRPGKPILAARRDGRLLLGLPGNPLSAFTGFQVFVAPALRRMLGHRTPVAPTLRATLLEAIRLRPGRWAYPLARLEWRDGEPVAMPVRSASSGDVLSLSRANAFIVVPASAGSIEAGRPVEVMPWGG